MISPEAVRPTYSVVVPVYDTPPDMFESMLASVLDQSYTRWELILCDDASPSSHVAPMLRAAAARDDRVTVIEMSENGGIAAATNAAIAAATGEFVAFLDHDDLLHRRALEFVTMSLERQPDADYLYTDEDKVTVDGKHQWPFFKPAWSRDRMKVQMYTTHLGVMRRSLVEEVGGLREGFEAAQDWDLVLRIAERTDKVVHVPEVAYSWRIHPASTASSTDAKPHAVASQDRAVQEHLDRTGFQAEVTRHPEHPEVVALRPRLRSEPLVSIVMPTAGSTRRVRGADVCLPINALRSVVDRSTYENIEVVLVVDTSTPERVIEEATALLGPRLRPLRWEEPFNFARKCNFGLLHSRGEQVLLLNDDVEVITPDWIEQMLMFSMDPGVGAVGAKLLFEDERIQHVGVTMNMAGLPGHSMLGYSNEDTGYALQARIVVNTSAVTAACLMSPRAAMLEVGGLSETFPNNYNDIDYCRKLASKGYRVVQNNQISLFHFESLTRDGTVTQAEMERFLERWPPGDPLYNPKLYPNVDFRPRWNDAVDRVIVGEG